MGINEKMTSIANGLRILSETSEPMGLDAMSGHISQANETVDGQSELIRQIKNALRGKGTAADGTVEPAKEEQEITFPTIIENGNYEILPDEGKVMSKAIVNVEVPTGGASDDDTDKLMNIIDGTISEFYIPDNIATIRPGLYYGCNNLVTAVIPNHVTSIGADAFKACDGLIGIKVDGDITDFDATAFSDCSNIIDIYVPWLEGAIAGAPWGATNATVHYDCNANDIIINGVLYVSPVKTSISQRAYENSGLFSKVIIPDSVTLIGNGAFYNCRSITSVVLGSNVNALDRQAFRFCYALTSIVIPTSMQEIDAYAFDSCKVLTDIYYAGTEEQWNLINIAIGNDSLLNATIHYNTPM